ncbi:hypothetical protein [Halosimplex sp. TS25]|uniref:hypothetical protein n=1 Tax=Halosimplex rarum TaxID=3396619 RepID=UPI0039E805D5
MSDEIGKAIFVGAVGLAVICVLAVAVLGGDVSQMVEAANGIIIFGFFIAIVVIFAGAVVNAVS